jgi:hypothetical protein
VGGGVAVYKVAAKEARVDVLNVAFASIPYFRGAFRGLASVGIGLFCTKVYVTELPKLGTASSVVLRFAWA